MHHALRNALMVEVEDLLAKVEVLQRGRPAMADLQRVLVVGDRPALLRRQHRHVAAGDLLGFAARPARHLLQIGRASSREKVCKYVYISVGAVLFNKKKKLLK